jgi:hypothetical protein
VKRRHFLSGSYDSDTNDSDGETAMSYKHVAMALAAAAILAAGVGVPRTAHAALEQAPCDTYAAYGQVADDTGMLLYFGSAGGCIAGRFQGGLVYTDARHGFTFRSTRITGYLIDPATPNSRDLCGFGKVNNQKQEVMFRVRVTENPGRDSVGITIDNWYAPERFYVISSREMKTGNARIFSLPRWNQPPRGFFDGRCAGTFPRPDSPA